MGLLRALRRNGLDTARAHCLEVDRRCQRNQAFVGADVRSRLFAADVLFAGRQREHKSAASLRVERFADEAAGNLARVFFARRKQAYIWSAKRKRHAKGL